MYHVAVPHSVATLATTTVDDLWSMIPRSSLKNDHHKWHIYYINVTSWWGRVKRVWQDYIMSFDFWFSDWHPPSTNSWWELRTKTCWSCVPDPLQLRPCIYRGDKESPRDLHKGAQSCHQMGRDREVGHSSARLGTASPNTVKRNQCAGPSKEQHHTAHQRGSTHPPH